VHAVSLTLHARFLRSKIDHISAKFEDELKKAVARESGAQEVLFDEKKTEGRKSHDTVPLKGQCHETVIEMIPWSCSLGLN
jgi:hypothetical protein